MEKIKSYEEISRGARQKVLSMIYEAQSSHIGSNFSCIDILSVLFEHMDLEKDELVISKGWTAAAVYYFLAEKGVIPKKDLERYCKEGEEEYIGLIEPRGKFGLRFAGGSMGYGLPAGVGFALAKKMKKETGKVYVLMSDGEQAIGTTWESALIAAHHKLDNLVVIVDYNGFQAMGKVFDVLRISPLGDKWSSFGWNTDNVDGHDHYKLESKILENKPIPKVIIAHTIKGKGAKIFEANNIYHYKNLTPEEYETAQKQIG